MSLKHPLVHAVGHAQELRKQSTSAEKLLWNALRNRKFHGLKFRRQAPVGRFIVDFLCAKPLLIIEIDGPIHDFRVKEDTDRTAAILHEYEIPLLRLKNDEVLKKLPFALQKIERVLFPPPHPLPPLPR